MWRNRQVVVIGEGCTVSMDARGFPVDEGAEPTVRDGFCPQCACPLDPGEHLCPDCILDMTVMAV